MLTIKNYNKLDNTIGENFYITKVEEYGYDYLFLMDTWGGKYKVGITVGRVPDASSANTDKYYRCQIGNKYLRCDPVQINERIIRDKNLFMDFIKHQVKRYEEKKSIEEGFGHPMVHTRINGTAGAIRVTSTALPKPTKGWWLGEERKLNIFQRLKSRWTMKMKEYAFRDEIGHTDVFYWKDCYGIEWVAESKWGMRTRKTENERTKL